MSCDPEKKRLAQPCKECPFKKTSVAGYLGASQPEDFIRATEVGVAMPCHMTVDYTDPNWKDTVHEAPLCEGAQSFLKNSHTLPYVPGEAVTSVRPDLGRDIPRVLAALEHAKQNEDVFRSRGEFILHHTRGKRSR